MSVLVGAQPPPMKLMEKWDEAYSGADATGAHVIALWQFDAGAENKDSSGHGHDLTLRGAKFSPDGRFGGALESFRGYPDKDEPHQAIAKNHRALSPQGAFTIEMWIKPKPELEGYPEAFLLDKKYVSHTDYQLILSAADGTGKRRLRMNLGFGAYSATFTSDAARFEPGVWYHIAFTYDGKGTGRFYLNGAAFGGGTKPGLCSIAPGNHPLVIGDRVGSYYHGFPGYIDQVRICSGVLEFRRVALAFASERTVYVRMEKAQPLKFTLTNLQRNPLTGAKVKFSLQGWQEQEITIPEMDSGTSRSIEYPLDTSLRPGQYRLVARIEIPGSTPYASEEQFPITIVARPLPHRMPVIMWGANPKEFQRLKDIGFTHCGGLWVDYAKVWEAGKPTEAADPQTIEQVKRDLDMALANDLRVFASLSPGRWARGKAEFRRVGRDGKPYPREDICGLFPALREFCYNVGASVAQTYGNFPAFDAALIHTEVRDHSQLCFHEHDKVAFKQFAGFDIPVEAVDLRGTPYQNLKDFPANRVIPDDYPLYVFYKWFWKQGDGWNDLHSAVHRGLKSTGRKDLWTWHDPAVRVASVWGSGGEVDVLSHWTYSYPDPLRIGMATDELLAMARGGPAHQKVMKMTQIIWYRSQTAPEPGETAGVQTPQFDDKDTKLAGKNNAASVGYRADWEKEKPDARFITIAPMHLREAFWVKIARPIQGIMYHGWESLVETDETGAYRYTHPETKNELRRLIKTVVEPLGPTLVQIPDRPSDVAFLESFASQMFAGRGTYGWSTGWAGDVYLVLMYAQLQPEIVYEETIVQRGLDGFKVLVMVDCDVLTETVVKKIQAFQQKGGIIIGDERLCPAIKPDILLQSFKRPKKADEARKLLQETAAKLRRQLDTRYQRYGESTNPDVIVRFRRYGSTDYLFAVNDRREFGNYVGHHGLVMENGLPSDTRLIIRRPTGFVYDLVRGRPVKATSAKGSLEIQAHFGPCEGRIYMITDRAIAGVRVDAPTSARLGETVDLKIVVVDEQGKAIDAIVPVKVDILDPAGRAAEFSGYYGAKDGQLEIRWDVAKNDAPGLWRVHVEELASGRVADAYVRVSD